MPVTMTTNDAKEKLADLINHVLNHKERILLTRRGKEVVAIVPLEDFQLLEMAEHKQDLAEAIEALKEAREQGAIALEDLSHALGT